MGRLVGENTHLQELCMSYYNGDLGINPFYVGLSNNKSISRLTLYWCEGSHAIGLLLPFFKGNHNLTELNIQWSILGTEECVLLASAIEECIGSLSSFKIDNVIDETFISDENLARIIQALSSHLHLRQLSIHGQNIGTTTLVVLESLLRTTKLHTLDLHRNVVSELVTSPMQAELADAMINHLNGNLMHLDVGGTINGGSVPVLMRWLPYSKLVSLNLSGIDLGETGVEALAFALKADPLEDLGLSFCGLRNVDMVAIAEALTENANLKEVNLSGNDAITPGSWMAFSRILCDTSTVNKTHLSNHTLGIISHQVAALPPDVVQSDLELNRCVDKSLVSKKKILKYHRHFDIQPFVQWEFKVLPLLIHWLDKAAPFSAEFEMNGTVEMRKLTVVYEFIQALPKLFVLSYTLQELVSLRQKIAEAEQRLARLQN